MVESLSLQDRIGQAPTATSSWALLHRGSPQAFIDALCAEALAHPAVNHPYLQRLASGELPDVRWAIRDFCLQYASYSTAFASYLEAVIGQLHLGLHRDVLRQNLKEERGQDAASHENISHAKLFQRFCRAAGVTHGFEAETPPCTTALLWRDQFLQLCRSNEAGVGIGAIGIGTELIVSSVYRFLHQAVTSYTPLAAKDYLFLSVHLECDDEHAEEMKRVSIDLAEKPGQREALRLGVHSSLNLRVAFWDTMLARALSL